MAEQIQENLNHNNGIQNDNEIKVQSPMIFSNIASCHICGMQMQFVEHDVIFGEDWYHGKCWKETQGGKQNV